MRLTIVLGTAVILGAIPFPQNRFADITKETQAKLLDAPALTYKLTASGRAVELCNHTRVKITGFRLGCVDKKDGDLTVLSEREFESVDIAEQNADSFHCWSVAAFDVPFPLEECARGKLAVVKVSLADGTIWNLASAPASPASGAIQHGVGPERGGAIFNLTRCGED